MTSLTSLSFEKLQSASVRVSSAIAPAAASITAAFRDKALRLFVLRGPLSPFVAARRPGFIRAYHRAFDAAPPVARVERFDCEEGAGRFDGYPSAAV